MNLPNKITLARICMIPVFLVFMLVPGITYGNYIAAGIFILAGLTDKLDGYLARKNNQITNFGKFMDPIADKLLVCSALICLVEYKLIPSWIVIIIIAREFIINGFRLIASDNGVVIAASWWGKIKTVVQIVLCSMLLINLDYPLINTLEQVTIYLALVLTVISLVDYMVKNKHVFFEGSNK
ncbi:MAG TPA: CDP-diacylglycerol--glycerol-3-phosphate 3-phosphatidyltransferase [Mobilitalea sp.]|nr:CDP-diacylglycerol--glycerol-3-phosphate 3-phosphatidyltransferase [Mobilitalea sp.]